MVICFRPGLDFSDSDDEDMETGAWKGCIHIALAALERRDDLMVLFLQIVDVGPSNMIGDTQIRQEYVILDEQQRQR